MELDSVNHRLFIPEPGNVRVLVYQLDETGRHLRTTANHVLGHRSMLGRRILASVTERNVGSGGTLAFDNVYQRLLSETVLLAVSLAPAFLFSICTRIA